MVCLVLSNISYGPTLKNQYGCNFQYGRHRAYHFKNFFSIKSLFLILEVQNFTQLIFCGCFDRIDIKRINRYGDKTDIRTIYFIRDIK